MPHRAHSAAQARLWLNKLRLAVAEPTGAHKKGGAGTHNAENSAAARVESSSGGGCPHAEPGRDCRLSLWRQCPRSSSPRSTRSKTAWAHRHTRTHAHTLPEVGCSGTLPHVNARTRRQQRRAGSQHTHGNPRSATQATAAQERCSREQGQERPMDGNTPTRLQAGR
jgi:hypothetical protein